MANYQDPFANLPPGVTGTRFTTPPSSPTYGGQVGPVTRNNFIDTLPPELKRRLSPPIGRDLPGGTYGGYPGQAPAYGEQGRTMPPEMRQRLMPQGGGGNQMPYGMPPGWGTNQPGITPQALNILQRQMQRMPAGWGGGSTGFPTGGQGGGWPPYPGGGNWGGNPPDGYFPTPPGGPIYGEPGRTMTWADIARGRFAPMPQFLTPSAQYWGQMGPTAQQQYGGYTQATMGWTPEEALWRQRMIAPPGGQPFNVNWR